MGHASSENLDAVLADIDIDTDATIFTPSFTQEQMQTWKKKRTIDPAVITSVEKILRAGKSNSRARDLTPEEVVKCCISINWTRATLMSTAAVKLHKRVWDLYWDCRLLGLPLELRLMIYKHLLPNKQKIGAKTYRRTLEDDLYCRYLSEEDPHLRYDEDRVHTAILLTCRQVYHEIVPDILYKGKTFGVEIYRVDIPRLGVKKVSWECIKTFPFGKIQCLEVRIVEPPHRNTFTPLGVRQAVCSLAESLARSPILNKIIITPVAPFETKEPKRDSITAWELILEPFRLIRARVAEFRFATDSCMRCYCACGCLVVTEAFLENMAAIKLQMESGESSTWTE
ncbi:hypothetical protein MMC11_002707 [Xylographa trunciseda]|nr:hypothetical protein [Xylographa trunciseda]